ncbi:MAG: Rieske 2Fe-2S domain-containing protein [Alphaproteobacteria bacterium]|nr:Rieske 2Fe-2S domain-containing protein [Alphaproteobacteria bacterium]MBU1516095.1 Rieske 2Fe-2S domain-containing protein [Alphaproteobacteria bacterium]MBU2092690.1 Rieske 2Fe-2S domain-containing protein [Alphaproteobacteria bacterium]MBU2153785.1 Rieske 2Fe-2S domain-containing protein [Alphaproteobacteria bacterium]MBU2308413.1 Rieske 2Fe-2S domain-containing protein [Alphaproteobacteria bacterium]
MRPADNELLCRVEGDAAMGQVMRQHWLPACMTEEVAEADGAPVRARLLGVDLVVFRDTKGRVGVLDEKCPHRGASLVFGRNENCGLRCLYHGWKFGVDGEIQEMASEPADSRMRNLKARAYPAQEAGGFVWVWMGDVENVRPFQAPAWAPSPTTKTSIVKMHAACNWAQVLEGSIDSAHSSSLHSTNMPTAEVEGSTATETAWLRPSNDKAPKLEVEATDYGFHYAAIRRPIRDPETHAYIRTTVFIAPFTVLIPPNDQYNLAQMLVPIDDVNCMFYWVAWHETKGIGQDAWRKFCAAEVGPDLEADFTKKRNLANNFLQDRAAMKAGDFTGIEGIPSQDMAMWESMGPIADRTEDHLGSSDVAIIQFRRQMVAAAKACAAGEPAIGTDSGSRMVDLASFEGVVSRAADWRTYTTRHAQKAAAE